MSRRSTQRRGAITTNIDDFKEGPPNTRVSDKLLYDPRIERNEQYYKKLNREKMSRRGKMTPEEKKVDNDKSKQLNLPYHHESDEIYTDAEQIRDIENAVARHRNITKPNDAYESSSDDYDKSSFCVASGLVNNYKSVKIHKLSPAQQRKLKKGNKVIIKGGGDHEIMLSPEQEKKFNKKSMMGCGITIQLDPYQQDMVMSGTGFKDFVGKMKKAKIGKKIIKFAKDNKILKRVSNALVERAIKTIAGSGVETVKRKRGRPRKGGALMAAGGGGALKPAGGALMAAGGGGALKPAGNY